MTQNIAPNFETLPNKIAQVCYSSSSKLKFLYTQFLDIFPKYTKFVLHSLTYTFLQWACENWKIWEPQCPQKWRRSSPLSSAKNLEQYSLPSIYNTPYMNIWSLLPKHSHLFFKGAGTNCGWTTLQMASVEAATCSIISFPFHASINLPSITVLILKLFWIKLLITTMPPSTISADKGKERKHR